MRRKIQIQKKKIAKIFANETLDQRSYTPAKGENNITAPTRFQQ